MLTQASALLSIRADRPGLHDFTDKVRDFLTGQRKQERGTAFINTLKSKSKIEVLI